MQIKDQIIKKSSFTTILVGYNLPQGLLCFQAVGTQKVSEAGSCVLPYKTVVMESRDGRDTFSETDEL